MSLIQCINALDNGEKIGKCVEFLSSDGCEKDLENLLNYYYAKKWCERCEINIKSDLEFYVNIHSSFRDLCFMEKKKVYDARSLEVEFDPPPLINELFLSNTTNFSLLVEKWKVDSKKCNVSLLIRMGLYHHIRFHDILSSQRALQEVHDKGLWSEKVDRVLLWSDKKRLRIKNKEMEPLVGWWRSVT